MRVALRSSRLKEEEARSAKSSRSSDCEVFEGDGGWRYTAPRSSESSRSVVCEWEGPLSSCLGEREGEGGEHVLGEGAPS